MVEVDCKAVRLCIFFACVEIARVLSRIRIARAGPVTLAVTLSRISKHVPVISFLVSSRPVRISVPCSFPSSCPVHIRDVLTLISISQITGQCLLAITSILCKTCSSSVATSPSSGDIARGIHTSAFPISFRRVYNCEHEGAHIITTQYQRMQSVLYHHKAQLHVPAQCPQKLGSNSNSHSAPPQLPPHHRKYIVVHIMHCQNQKSAVEFITSIMTPSANLNEPARHVYTYWWPNTVGNEERCSLSLVSSSTLRHAAP